MIFSDQYNLISGVGSILFYLIRKRAISFLKIYIFLILERRDRNINNESDNHQSAAFCMSLTVNQSCNSSICPEWKSNPDLLIHRSMLNH